jgi:uncharacterized membrane protein
VVLREKEYDKIAKALFVLGALLYTLSIFLIAQIFNILNTSQSVSWLLLMAFIGVSFSAYFFGSYTTLIVAMIEFLFWINIQFFALAMRNSQEFSPVLFAFLFLFAGVFFYSMNLLHKSLEHNFAKLFQWWTAFYFLTFFYILSFQSLLPILWVGSIGFNSAVIFLGVFAFITVISLIGSIIIALNKEAVSSKELLVVLAIILVLLGCLFLAKIPSNLLGSCYEKQCYDYNDQNSCSQSSDCEWKEIQNSDWIPSCVEKQCYNYKDITSCESNYFSLGCKWENNSNQYPCSEINCYDLNDSISCQNAPKNLDCLWENERCNYNYNYDSNSKEGCNQYSNKKASCDSNPTCKWSAGNNYFRSKTSDLPFSVLFIWILINIVFILVILAVIGYGSIEKSRSIINLGIIVFVLDIITRYAGFIMDLWGYNLLSIMFIVGGIILIVGGWLIEKWRRSLITKTGK